MSGNYHLAQAAPRPFVCELCGYMDAEQNVSVSKRTHWRTDDIEQWLHNLMTGAHPELKLTPCVDIAGVIDRDPDYEMEQVARFIMEDSYAHNVRCADAGKR